MPEYHCGVEVQAAIDAGLNVRYYRVSRDLSVDEEDLERRLRACPGPVLLIHYFGFAQPGVKRIAQLCQELGVTLIEDCAHALFSSHGEIPLGAFAPVSVFSLKEISANL
jgi:dTDP-4-amino-4,6-dideoxygalactose transaminase